MYRRLKTFFLAVGLGFSFCSEASFICSRHIREQMKAIEIGRFENAAYYRKNLYQKSTTEMARELGLSPYRVFLDLIDLSLSVPFSLEYSEPDPLEDISKKLAKIGKSELLISLVPELTGWGQIRTYLKLGLGYADIGYLTGISPSVIAEMLGTSEIFRPVIDTPAGFMTFDMYVCFLHREGYSAEEIAEIVPRHADGAGRTQTFTPSVGEIERTLNRFGAYSNRQPKNGPVHRYPYGDLRANSQLFQDKVIAFLTDHAHRSDEWLAEALDISQHELPFYYQELGMERDSKHPLRFRFPNHQTHNRNSWKQYATRKIVNWIRHHGRIPNSVDFGTAPEKVGLPYQKLMNEVFDSMEEMWFEVADAGMWQGVFISLLDLKQVGQPEKLRTVWQREAADRVIDWILKNDRYPDRDKDYGFDSTEKVKLDYHRFTGTGVYAGETKRPRRIFDNAEVAWRYVKQRALTRGIVLHTFLNSHFQDPSDLVRQERSQESSDVVIRWLFERRTYPRDKDFGLKAEEVGVNSQFYYGTGHCRVGAPSHASRFHNSPAEAKAVLKNRLLTRALETLIPLVE